MEQDEYAKEGIAWKHLEFVDNEEILYLIGVKPNSLLMLIDEQSQLITGTDEAVITKANNLHAKNKYYIKQKSDLSLYFGIAHYAGIVNYSVEGFTSKNRNPLSNNWLQLIQTSRNMFLKGLFSKELTELKQASQPKVRTVALQYQNSLEALLKLMNLSVPYFIRCIKPNLLKKPREFDHVLCCCQLRYSGMMDTARIRRSGYPVRYTYSEFSYRYKIILESNLKNKLKEHKKVSEEIARKVLGNNDYQFGKTKIFLKTKHDVLLEISRNKVLEKKIVIIQKNVKALYAKNRYQKMRNAAISIQKHWRAYTARRNYFVMKLGFFRLQASIRSRQSAYYFTRFRLFTLNFQARCRGYLLRKTISTKLKKAPSYKREESIGDIDAWITNVFNSALDGNEITPL